MAKVAAEAGSTANRYEILAKLARGGMADIFLARGQSSAGVERHCVLKRVLPERASDTQFVQMFVDEARLAAQLQHPNIASVYDTGKLGDSYFFTMEYVHGETVLALCQRSTELGRPVPLACALTIIAGAAAGLHHAHERNGVDGRALGIVHRDVSPSNLMVSYEGTVKVVDFGVAKAAHRVGETQSGTVKGKISYLSPEQCRGKGVDRRSDLFSLGIVMWEMLTGRRLYRRDSDFATMAAIVHEEAVPPSVYRTDASREVDGLVLRLLAKSAAQRFQSAAEVVDRIEAVALHAGIMLSTSALGRLVRDLFGPRPEPWLDLDLDSKIVPVESFSDMADATVSGSVLSAVDMIEAALEDVAQLGAARAPVDPAQDSEPGPPSSSTSTRAAGLAAADDVVIARLRGLPLAAGSSAITVVPASPLASRRWVSWLLASVIGGAALAGIVAAWFAIRVDSSGSPGDAATVAIPVQMVPDQAPPDAPPQGSASRGAMAVSDTQEGAIDPEEIEIIDAGDQRPDRPVGRTRVASPPAAPQEPRNRAATVRPASPPKPTPSPDDVAEFSRCGSAVMSARRAPDCTRAACRSGAGAKAVKWVAYIPGEQRTDLIALCKEVGIDLTMQKLDCAADATACP